MDLLTKLNKLQQKKTLLKKQIPSDLGHAIIRNFKIPKRDSHNNIKYYHKDNYRRHADGKLVKLHSKGDIKQGKIKFFKDFISNYNITPKFTQNTRKNQPIVASLCKILGLQDCKDPKQIFSRIIKLQRFYNHYFPIISQNNDHLN